MFYTESAHTIVISANCSSLNMILGFNHLIFCYRLESYEGNNVWLTYLQMQLGLKSLTINVNPGNEKYITMLEHIIMNILFATMNLSRRTFHTVVKDSWHCDIWTHFKQWIHNSFRNASSSIKKPLFKFLYFSKCTVNIKAFFVSSPQQLGSYEWGLCVLDSLWHELLV